MKQFKQISGMNSGFIHNKPNLINCDVCGKGNLCAYVDGKTRRGPWANMCLACHDEVGVGLGTGKGQMFVEIPNNGR